MAHQGASGVLNEHLLGDDRTYLLGIYEPEILKFGYLTFP